MSQFTAIVCAGGIIFAIYFLLPLLYFLPRCVLGSV